MTSSAIRCLISQSPSVLRLLLLLIPHRPITPPPVFTIPTSSITGQHDADKEYLSEIWCLQNAASRQLRSTLRRKEDHEVFISGRNRPCGLVPLAAR